MVKVDGRKGCINRNGEVVIEPKYEDIHCTDDELIPFEAEGKWGFLHRSGAVVLEPQFWHLPPVGYSNQFSEGLAAVCINRKCGYIDSTGHYTIEPRFDYAENFRDGFAVVQFGAVDVLGYRLVEPQEAFIDKTGNLAFAGRGFTPRTGFSDGVAAVMLEGRTIYIDRNGELVIGPDRSLSGKFSEGLAVATETPMGAFGYVNKRGETVIPYEYKQAGEFSEGLASVMFQNGRYGFIDQQGKTVIAPIYDNVDYFYEGRASVRLGRKYGFINKIGGVIIPIEYGSAERFVNGLARFSPDDQNTPYDHTRYGYLDLQGNVVWQPSR